MINRLSSELQAARQILATLPHGNAGELQASKATAMEIEAEEEEESVNGFPGISADVLAKLQDTGSQLFIEVHFLFCLLAIIFVVVVYFRENNAAKNSPRD